MTAVNPQVCVPYFTVEIPVYHEDTHTTVVDRICRTSSVPGEIVVPFGTLKFVSSLLKTELLANGIPFYVLFTN